MNDIREGSQDLICANCYSVPATLLIPVRYIIKSQMVYVAVCLLGQYMHEYVSLVTQLEFLGKKMNGCPFIAFLTYVTGHVRFVDIDNILKKKKVYMHYRVPAQRMNLRRCTYRYSSKFCSSETLKRHCQNTLYVTVRGVRKASRDACARWIIINLLTTGCSRSARQWINIL